MKSNFDALERTLFKYMGQSNTSILNSACKIPKSLIQNYLGSRVVENPLYLKAISRQLDRYSKQRSGLTTILVPAYNEPLENLIKLHKSISHYKGEVIILINNGAENNSTIENIKLVNSFNRYIASEPSSITTIVIDGTEVTCNMPSIGTYRDLLICIEAIRSLREFPSEENCAGRRLLITDADCTLNCKFIDFFDQVFDCENILAQTCNIAFDDNFDPKLSEGICTTDQFKKVILGEFIRNIIDINNSASPRDERPWIGMGIGCSLISALLVDGFPRGWNRKEDHYFGIMLEKLSELTLGSIYYANKNCPPIVSYLRGSTRTDAGLGIIGELSNGDLKSLESIAERYSNTQIVDLFLKLSSEQKHKILNMPTTILLVKLIEKCKVELVDLTPIISDYLFENSPVVGSKLMNNFEFKSVCI